MTGVAGNQQDRAALDRLIRGFQISRMIRLVADLTLADRIAPEERRHAAALARIADAWLRAMRERRALAARLAHPSRGGQRVSR